MTQINTGDKRPNTFQLKTTKRFSSATSYRRGKQKPSDNSAEAHLGIHSQAHSIPKMETFIAQIDAFQRRKHISAPEKGDCAGLEKYTLILGEQTGNAKDPVIEI